MIAQRNLLHVYSGCGRGLLISLMFQSKFSSVGMILYCLLTFFLDGINCVQRMRIGQDISWLEEITSGFQGIPLWVSSTSLHVDDLFI